MEKFIIEGSCSLSGEVEISGAKNAILPIMAASLLTKGITILKNVPCLEDISTMIVLLEKYGAKVKFSSPVLEIDTTNTHFAVAPYDIVRKLRASIYLLAPSLVMFQKAQVSFPGGCAIGTRPVDMHLKALEILGAEINIEHGDICAKAKSLKGNDIIFDKPSVGATATALMLSVLANGKTKIVNAALEPEIGSLISFLNKMGAKIKGKDSNILEIEGKKSLQAVKMSMIPDRIEAGTFLIAGAISKSKLKIKNCLPKHLVSLLEVLKEAGFTFEIKEKEITILPIKEIKSVKKITTNPYPGFPTDLQAQFMALMCLANDTCVIDETIFPDRFMHVNELNRLGANVLINNMGAIVKGVSSLSGAKIVATDLRAGAALVLAGLVANGKTEIHNIFHIDRGYDKIEEKLQKIGAKIQRVNE